MTKVGNRLYSNMDKISVIVPVYNVEKYLDKCVESIVNQTYENLEIILVDDGSTDNCPQMCDDWAERDSRIIVIHKENGGVSSTRNAGLDCATGQYIGFVDADDYIELNMYEILLKAIKLYQTGIVVCNNTHVDNHGNILSFPTENAQVFIKDEDLMVSFIKGTIFDSTSTCNKLFKSEIILKNSIRFPTDIKVGEDLLFNYSVIKYSSGLILIKDVLYNYVFHSDSAMRKINSDVINRWRNIKFILEKEKYNKKIYYIALKKYSSELLCCLRELLRSEDYSLINKHYIEITNEIKKYTKEFLQVKDLTKMNRLCIKIISFNPKLFKSLYSFYNHLTN